MTDDDPDFGPSGYLPDRAARQARKIILRAPLGLEWLVASAVFGVVLLVAGTVFLTTRSDGSPAPPFEGLISVTAVERSGGHATQSEQDVLYVLFGVQPRVFPDLAALGLQWCEASEQIEGADGRAWTETGRGLGGAPSLDRHPAVVWEGTIHVDRTRRVPGPSPSDEPATLAC